MSSSCADQLAEPAPPSVDERAYAGVNGPGVCARRWRRRSRWQWRQIPGNGSPPAPRPGPGRLIIQSRLWDRFHEAWSIGPPIDQSHLLIIPRHSSSSARLTPCRAPPSSWSSPAGFASVRAIGDDQSLDSHGAGSWLTSLYTIAQHPLSPSYSNMNTASADASPSILSR